MKSNASNMYYLYICHVACRCCYHINYSPENVVRNERPITSYSEVLKYSKFTIGNQKSSTNATTVRTQLQHFESAINDNRNNLPEPDCNSHYSVKRVRKDSDVRVEAREACDIISRAATDGWMDGWMDRWMEGWMDGGMDGWRDGWMEGWMYGWMEGWMDFKDSTAGHTMIAPEELAITHMAMNMGIVNTEKRIDTQTCSKHSQHKYAST
ncbi:hypothetical protein C0J52_27554 [Blattella germanica]|nr:hypothetical protein C0J52_27554 [Blattella germanica]